VEFGIALPGMLDTKIRILLGEGGRIALNLLKTSLMGIDLGENFSPVGVNPKAL